MTSNIAYTETFVWIWLSNQTHGRLMSHLVLSDDNYDGFIVFVLRCSLALM